DDLETPIPPLPERNEAAEKKNDERYSYDGMVQELRERQKKIEERDRELQEKMKVTDDEMESEETKPDSADVAGTNAEMEVNDSDAATDSAPKQEAKDSEEKSAADESN
ncbi:MAG: hypothetical protein IT290_03235, partial [Deltaproteobacteria bacterium]|nr:hypothetical protein [Deltaproteobacteria bacterium]